MKGIFFEILEFSIFPIFCMNDNATIFLTNFLHNMHKITRITTNLSSETEKVKIS